MLFGEGLLGFVVLAFWIWALVDAITTQSSDCRNLPKAAWIILVIILFGIGAVLWLLLGRPNKHWRPATPGDYSAPRRVVGAEDRTGFGPAITDRRSAELDRRLAEWEANQSRPSAIGAGSGTSELSDREVELARREEELRQRELELRGRELEARERELDGE